MKSRDKYKALEEATILDDIEGAPEAAEAERREKRPRVRRLPNLFVRVPIQWLTHPVLRYPMQDNTRLFLYVLFKSYDGQRGVRMTNALAAEVGISPRRKQKLIRAWEQQGCIRVQRVGQRVPVIWPIMIAG